MTAVFDAGVSGTSFRRFGRGTTSESLLISIMVGGLFEGFGVDLEADVGFFDVPFFRLDVDEGPGVESRGREVGVAGTLRVLLRRTREDRGDFGWNISVRRV